LKIEISTSAETAILNPHVLALCSCQLGKNTIPQTFSQIGISSKKFKLSLEKTEFKLGQTEFTQVKHEVSN
jgi:acyl-[acyl carrier protein]--UDP-N-acetylglucosamine O-acyltransferase